jgi:hypothetical protein
VIIEISAILSYNLLEAPRISHAETTRPSFNRARERVKWTGHSRHIVLSQWS